MYPNPNRNLSTSSEPHTRVLAEWTNPTSGQVEPLPDCLTIYRDPANTDSRHDGGVLVAYCNAFDEDDRCCVGSGACGNWADSGKVTMCKAACRGKKACDGFGAGDYTIGQKACDGDESCNQVGAVASPKILIEGNSCTGARACYTVGYDATGDIEIKAGSCKGDRACYYYFHGVGADDCTINGCNGIDSCDFWINPYTRKEEQVPNCFTAYRSDTKSGALHDDGVMFKFCDAHKSDADKCCITQGEVGTGACKYWQGAGKVTMCKGACHGGASCSSFGPNDYTIGAKSCDGHKSCNSVGSQGTNGGDAQIEPNSCRGIKACQSSNYNNREDFTITGCVGDYVCQTLH